MIRTPLKALTVALLLSGCSQIPHYESPEIEVPAQLDMVQTSLTLPATEQAWWAQFNDPELETWLQKALQHNSDFNIAHQRIFQARAYLTQGRAEHYPRIDLEGGALRQQNSDMAFPTGQGQTFNQLTLGALLQYELDLWGRVAANERRLDAQYQALKLDTEALRLSLMASVAQSYFSLRALDQMVQLSQHTVQSRQETLKLRQTQYQHGSITQLAVQQAEVELSRVELHLSNLKQQRQAQRHALSILVGDSPQDMLNNRRSQSATLTFSDYALPILPNELPSELLIRRPDIQAAEQRMSAANANIGVARAALFPRVSLSGLIGLSSEAANDLFSSDAVQWQGGARVTAPIFNAGALRAQVQITEAEQDIAFLDYQQNLRQAFRETLDALADQHFTTEQLSMQQRQVDSLRKTLELAQKRFDSGYTNYLEVLDAQRALFDAELNMVTIRLQQFNAGLQLYKAIGGHWSLNAQSTD